MKFNRRKLSNKGQFVSRKEVGGKPGFPKLSPPSKGVWILLGVFLFLFAGFFFFFQSGSEEVYSQPFLPPAPTGESLEQPSPAISTPPLPPSPSETSPVIEVIPREILPEGAAGGKPSSQVGNQGSGETPSSVSTSNLRLSTKREYKDPFYYPEKEKVSPPREKLSPPPSLPTSLPPLPTLPPIVEKPPMPSAPPQGVLNPPPTPLGLLGDEKGRVRALVFLGSAGSIEVYHREKYVGYTFFIEGKEVLAQREGTRWRLKTGGNEWETVLRWEKEE